MPTRSFNITTRRLPITRNTPPFDPDGTLNPATTGPNARLQDEQTFFADLNSGKLPSVCFIKPLGPDNEHPGYAALLRGQQHVADIVNAVQNTKFWKDSVIIITYDENGDFLGPRAGADGRFVGRRNARADDHCSAFSPKAA